MKSFRLKKRKHSKSRKRTNSKFKGAGPGQIHPEAESDITYQPENGSQPKPKPNPKLKSKYDGTLFTRRSSAIYPDAQIELPSIQSEPELQSELELEPEPVSEYDGSSKILGFIKEYVKYFKYLQDFDPKLETKEEAKSITTNYGDKIIFYKNTIIGILNNPELDLSKIYPLELLENVMQSDDDIIDSYLNIENPYLTDDIFTDIVINLEYANTCLNLKKIVEKMEKNKSNFPNATKFLKKQLNITNLLELIKGYNERLPPYYSKDQRITGKFSAIYYKNTIIDILTKPNLDLSKIDQSELLRNVIKSNDDDIIEAYVNLYNPLVTEHIIKKNIKQHITDSNKLITKMTLHKKNFPNITTFLDDEEVHKNSVEPLMESTTEGGTRRRRKSRKLRSRKLRRTNRRKTNRRK